MTKKRKQYTAREKVGILRQHLLEDVAVSEVCDQHDLQPTVFYRWQKQLFEEGGVVFERRRDTEKNRLKQRVEQLEAKVQKKNEVVSELMEEYIALKKELGAP
ncbi:transposase [Neptuniibacter sp.]|uniref:transposase n=1 Tax=Neptuniibacter sp. TaxID=1962643 RepID=UPI00261E1151|nr:transposase [Neptuniibacter sp.]MCP4594857.1 transposase [Neptuniibacter sp.]